MDIRSGSVASVEFGVRRADLFGKTLYIRQVSTQSDTIQNDVVSQLVLALYASTLEHVPLKASRRRHPLSWLLGSHMSAADL